VAERFEFTLDSVEAVMVGGAVKADVRRFPLRIRNTTIDPVRFAKLAVRVRDVLERRGLSSADELHPSVRAAMELFTEHQVSVSVTGRDAKEEDLAMVAMSDGAQAVTVTQAARSDTLRFSLFSDEELVSTIARFLPTMPSAPRGDFTVAHHPRPTMSAMAARRRARAEADAEEDDAFGNLDVVGTLASGPTRPAPRRGDAERLGEIMSGQRLGVGFLTAAGRRRSGERRSAPPMGWVDTGLGRYLVETTTDDYGSTTATYRPAGGPEVEKAVRQLISKVY
jgi:EspG family